MATCKIDLPTIKIGITIFKQSLLLMLRTYWCDQKRRMILLTCVFTLGELFDRLGKGEFHLLNCWREAWLSCSEVQELLIWGAGYFKGKLPDKFMRWEWEAIAVVMFLASWIARFWWQTKEDGSIWPVTCADSFISAFLHERFCNCSSVW